MTSSRLFKRGTTDFLDPGRRGQTRVMLAVLCSPAAAATAAVSAGKMAAAVAKGKVEAMATEKVDVGDSKNDAVKAPTKTVVARPRLPAAMAAAESHRR